MIAVRLLEGTVAIREKHNEEGRAVVETHFGRPVTDKEAGVIDEVNVRMDQFAHFPSGEMLSRHRKFLHHAEGIDYFRRWYGKVGELVATKHVETDCGHIPKAIDYYNGTVNEYGLRVR